jgi:hypothetical protein
MLLDTLRLTRTIGSRNSFEDLYRMQVLPSTAAW